MAKRYIQSCQAVIRNESEILNVGMSKPPKVASRPAMVWGRCKRPSGVRCGAPEQKYVSKWTHGFFITINSMILYFKHIIHIDEFSLNGHPPSIYYLRRRVLPLERRATNDPISVIDKCKRHVATDVATSNARDALTTIKIIVC